MKKMEGHVFRMYDTNADGTFFLITFSVNGYLSLIFYLISVILTLRSRCNQHGRISSRLSCPVKWNSRRELAGSLNGNDYDDSCWSSESDVDNYVDNSEYHWYKIG